MLKPWGYGLNTFNLVYTILPKKESHGFYFKSRGMYLLSGVYYLRVQKKTMAAVIMLQVPIAWARNATSVRQQY